MISSDCISTQPLVSVCVPLYNAESYFEEMLASVLNQTYQNIEIVVVEDHSTDASWDIAKRYAENGKIKLYRNPRKGACAARNYAFEKASGEYVMFMDADDLISEKKIEAQVSRLIHDGSVNTIAVCTLRLLRDGILEKAECRTFDRTYDNPIELLIDMWAEDGGNNCPHCYLFHRSLFLLTDGWDETLLKNQDGEFFARLISKADKVLFTDNEYAIWRLTNKGISSRKNINAIESQLRAIESIANVILLECDDAHARHSCAVALGWWLYLNYPDNKKYLNRAKDLLDQWRTKMIIPETGRLFKIMRLLCGWRKACRIVRDARVIKICSKISHALS